MTEAGIFLTGAVVLGIGATLFMDAVAVFQKRLLNVQGLNYAMVGRWIGHLPRGRLVHHSIGAAPPVRGEAVLGWLAHYNIGIVFAALFLGLVGMEWLGEPMAWQALSFGVCTVIAPFAILQPGMGAGFAASRTLKPWTARGRSLLAHVSFGLGLYVVAVILSALYGQGLGFATV